MGSEPHPRRKQARTCLASRSRSFASSTSSLHSSATLCTSSLCTWSRSSKSANNSSISRSLASRAVLTSSSSSARDVARSRWASSSWGTKGSSSMSNECRRREGMASPLFRVGNRLRSAPPGAVPVPTRRQRRRGPFGAPRLDGAGPPCLVPFVQVHGGERHCPAREICTQSAGRGPRTPERQYNRTCSSFSTSLLTNPTLLPSVTPLRST